MTTTETATETKAECRFRGCSQPGEQYRYLDLTDEDGANTGQVDKVFLCAEHAKVKLKELPAKINDDEIVTTIPSPAAVAEKEMAVPLNEAGSTMLSADVEDVTVTGVGKDPATFRAFRIADDEWAAALAQCRAEGVKIETVVRNVIRSLASSAPKPGADDAQG